MFDLVDNITFQCINHFSGLFADFEDHFAPTFKHSINSGGSLMDMGYLSCGAIWAIGIALFVLVGVIWLNRIFAMYRSKGYDVIEEAKHTQARWNDYLAAPQDIDDCYELVKKNIDEVKKLQQDEVASSSLMPSQVFDTAKTLKAGQDQIPAFMATIKERRNNYDKSLSDYNKALIDLNKYTNGVVTNFILNCLGWIPFFRKPYTNVKTDVENAKKTVENIVKEDEKKKCKRVDGNNENKTHNENAQLNSADASDETSSSNNKGNRSNNGKNMNCPPPETQE